MLEHEQGSEAGQEKVSPDSSAPRASEPATTSNAATSIHFPAGDPVIPQVLSAEEAAAVEALPAGSALLIAHSGPNAGSRFLMDKDEVGAGRHPEADVFLDDVTVSRRHALFTREDAGYRVTDSGSLNGTYVNGDRVDSVLLRNGSEVQIGKFRLTYYVGVTA